MARMVEIDEEELLRNHKLRQTVSSLLANPAAKLKIQEATKMVFPNAVTPELDQHRQMATAGSQTSTELAALRKQIEDDKAARADETRLRALHEKHEAGFAKLRQTGWTDAGIAEVRKIMEERGILDHEIAAAYYEKQNPPQAPISPNGRGGWDFMSQIKDDDKDLQSLIASKGENNGLIDKMAQDALNEVRGSRR